MARQAMLVKHLERVLELMDVRDQRVLDVGAEAD